MGRTVVTHTAMVTHAQPLTYAEEQVVVIEGHGLAVGEQN
jgi:hypothetical protein